VVVDIQRCDTEATSISVVMPCLNEAESIAKCVIDARAGIAATGLPGEVVVVDNGSIDGSAELAELAGARVVYAPSPGYGAALTAGIRAARGTIVVMADADDTYDFHMVPALVAPVLEGEADLVVGSRLSDLESGTMPMLHRRVGTPILTFLVGRAAGGLRISDSQSGFRAFRRSTILRLRLESAGMEFASEMLIRAARAGLRIREVDAGYRHRIGESKLHTFRDGARHLQLITLLAPDLLLLGPGATLLALGTLLSLYAIAFPAGLQLGSLRWQPVFFSSIALVLGLQMVLAGAAIANRSSIAAGSLRVRFAFVSEARFLDACVASGVGACMAGLAIDLGLFVISVIHHPSPSRGLALAALAQSLLIIGGSLVLFGTVGRWVARGGALHQRPEPKMSTETPPVTADGLRQHFLPAADEGNVVA